MKKLITLLFGLLFTITAYSQNGYSSVFLRVTDSATFVNSANTIAKHTADYADIWYSVNSGLFWKWSTVTNTYTLLGAGGWVTTGVQQLTGPFGVESADSIGITSDAGVYIRSPRDVTSSIITGTPGGGNEYAQVGVYRDATFGSYAFMTSSNSGASEIATMLIQSWPGGQSSADVNADTIHISQDAITTLKIVPSGAWQLGASQDPGGSGEVLTSNGAGSAPTWQPAAGGGTPGGSDTQVQYNNAGAFAGISGATTNGTILSATTPAVGTNTTQVQTTAGAIAQIGKAWTDWSASVSPTGFSATTTVVSHYKDDGSTVTIYFVISGTSNATTFTVTLPVAMNANYGTDGFISYAWVLNNAAPLSGMATCSGGSTTVNIFTSSAAAAFTNSGTKALRVTLTYRK